jgi:hypothetical protein
VDEPEMAAALPALAAFKRREPHLLLFRIRPRMPARLRMFRRS